MRHTFGVTIPDIQVCSNHTTPWRAFRDAYFALSSVTVWKASRTFGGKSFLLATLGLTEATTLGISVNLQGGSGKQSTNVHDYMQNFWKYLNAPRHLLASDPSEYKTRLIGGNTIEALMASTKASRGPHPTRLRMDEVDEMDIKVLDAAMGQPMGKHGVRAQTVLSSTHHYADGTFTEVLKRAAEKSWPVYEWCFRESYANGQGWLDLVEIEEKRHDVTQNMWDNEYELQEPNPESRAIDGAKLRLMFDASLGEFEGYTREAIEIEPPIFGARYAHGADWARKQHFSVVVTLRTDVRPFKLVAFERRRREPWPDLVGVLNNRVKRYGGSGYHDGTGIGDVVDGYMEAPDISLFLMVGRARSDLLTEYIAAVENGEIEAPMIKFLESTHRLASNDDVFGAGHLPDTMAAMSLAYRKADEIEKTSDWSQTEGLGHDEEYINRWGDPGREDRR